MQKIPRKYLQRSAFTMLELVFVIVVIGIISSVVFSRSGSNKTAEARVQILSHIRYAQHLAMLDDQFDATNNNWFTQRWQVFFRTHTDGSNDKIYVVYSDINEDNQAANTEAAIDTSSGRRLSGFVMNSMNLTSTYGISHIQFGGSCANNNANGGGRIVFDYLGRPHTDDNNNHSDIITGGACLIEFEHSDGNFTITIEPETGYAR